MSTRPKYRDNYDPETLAILESAFTQAWEGLVASGGLFGGLFNEQLTRETLADLIISFASEGETDPKRLKELALTALPQAMP